MGGICAELKKIFPVALSAADESGCAQRLGASWQSARGRIRVLWSALGRGKKYLMPTESHLVFSPYLGLETHRHSLIVNLAWW